MDGNTDGANRKPEPHDLIPDSKWIRQFRNAVRAWYRRHARELPWLEESDPYRVWVREIMLQQTTVKAVVPYLERFFAAFPTVCALASADQQDVLKLWEGLGYYSRARNLHAAANQIVSGYGKGFPQDLAAIQALPGIGRYTASAIASFAFGDAAPIVEANTSRLYARLIALNGDLTRSHSQKTLWTFAGAIVPKSAPGPFNQALMDLGATVCVPTSPNCGQCPVRALCTAFERNLVADIPMAKKRSEPTRLYEAAVAIARSGKYLMRQRRDAEWWTGLWDFPRVRLENAPHDAQATASLFDELDSDVRTLERRLCDETGMTVQLRQPHKIITHAVTRYRIRLACYVAVSAKGRPRTHAGYRWIKTADMAELPMTRTARQFANSLQDHAIM